MSASRAPPIHANDCAYETVVRPRDLDPKCAKVATDSHAIALVVSECLLDVPMAAVKANRHNAAVSVNVNVDPWPARSLSKEERESMSKRIIDSLSCFARM